MKKVKKVIEIEVEEVECKVIPNQNCPYCKGTGIVQEGESKGLACLNCMKFAEPKKKKKTIELDGNKIRL